MKKAIVSILLICMLLSLAACGKSKNSSSEAASNSAEGGQTNGANSAEQDIKPITPKISLADDGSNALEYYAQFVEVKDYTGIKYTPATVEVTLNETLEACESPYQICVPNQHEPETACVKETPVSAAVISDNVTNEPHQL